LGAERILVVDDNPTNLKLLRALLEDEGYDVSIASNAETALEVLHRLAPQLILMDLQLPGVSGVELTRQLKTNPATREIDIIGLTASPLKADEESMRAAGCDGYMTKPLNLEALCRLIAQHLGRSSAS
jgi:CheY-like chemotaxis protein